MFIRKKKGQSILEYAVFLAVLVAVIVVMQIYVKRAIQGKFKSTADSIGEQFSTGVEHTSQTIVQTARDDTFQTVVGEVQKSEISAAADWAVDLGDYQKIGDDYKGAELQARDFVEQDVGGGEVAEHSFFDSGVLAGQKIYDDDE